MSQAEKEPTLLVIGDRRRRGRPKAEQTCVSLSTWVPVSYADRLIALAARKDVSVSSLVRQLVILQLRHDR